MPLKQLGSASLSIKHRLYHPEYLFIRDGSADPDVDVIIRYRQNSRLIARIVRIARNCFGTVSHEYGIIIRYSLLRASVRLRKLRVIFQKINTNLQFLLQFLMSNFIKSYFNEIAFALHFRDKLIF